RLDQHSVEDTRAKVLNQVKATIERLGGDPAQARDDSWHSFDIWPYFKHVSSESLRNGFYDKLEGLQGTQGTFYAGGLMDFELVERIVRYSKNLVELHFPNAS